jgi:glycosyltransferase involved in cell wall biosynthesis
MAMTRPDELEVSDRTEVSPSPRILITTVMSPTGTTGLQTHVQEVRDYFARAGRSVQIVTPRSRADYLATPVFAARLALDRLTPAGGLVMYRSSHRVFLTNALRHELKDGANTVVYAQCPVSARAALDARRHRGQRVVMCVHYDGSQADEWFDKGTIAKGGPIFRSIRNLEDRTLGEVDGLVFVAESARRALTACIPNARNVPWQVIPNFTNSRGPVTSPLEDPADLITIGGLEVAKNQAYLVDVLAAANEMGHRYTLDIIGEGPTRREITQRMKELGVEDQVRLRGRIPGARCTLPGHRAYVHSAVREAFPYALVEAMDAGLPIVAPRTGGIPEMFEDGVEGRIWPLDDPQTAARILIDLLEDDAERARAAAAAEARFANRYAAAVVGPALERVLLDGFSSC